jgi:glycerol-3-phosphate O-acyltransferase
MNLKQLIPWIGLDSLGLWLARKLLFVWVKTTVIPDNPATLRLADGQPVFYILEARSLSNLLVLEQECLHLGLPQPSAPLITGQVSVARSVGLRALVRGGGHGGGRVLGGARRFGCFGEGL